MTDRLPSPSPTPARALPDRRRALQLLGAGCAAVALAACTDSKPSFQAVDITGADYAKDFRLSDMNGQPRSMADFKGKAVVLFFGYAQCPDVCPTTMSEMLQVREKLGADGQRVQVLFVTVDPERDTPEVMKAYMTAFDPSFLALIPTPEKLPALAKDFKVYYKKVDGKTPTSYSMDHSAATFIYDPQGRLRLYARYGLGTDALASDLKTLLAAG
ncbi:SCO family protein [Pseudacidovorax intermedius]|uniref:SCO family protein n=1 Tax=Pseudacidovorax intermedius TaxID=433924 RepID=UPI0007347E52|nr:SCO family protein [Pseudacidovorax intermedius]